VRCPTGSRGTSATSAVACLRPRSWRRPSSIATTLRAANTEGRRSSVDAATSCAMALGEGPWSARVGELLTLRSGYRLRTEIAYVAYLAGSSGSTPLRPWRRGGSPRTPCRTECRASTSSSSSKLSRCRPPPTVTPRGAVAADPSGASESLRQVPRGSASRSSATVRRVADAGGFLSGIARRDGPSRPRTSPSRHRPTRHSGGRPRSTAHPASSAGPPPSGLVVAPLADPLQLGAWPSASFRIRRRSPARPAEGLTPSRSARRES
jgi:hypothetical protein